MINYLPLRILDGNRNNDLMNLSNPSTANPKILKGIDNNQKIG
ncbi:MAG: hypothetical protein QY331_01460 [Melioribacteraceae bacterium]|nr:MAG: hypothetical protein QY331_01460 [Melioribacteraceae bacterium]